MFMARLCSSRWIASFLAMTGVGGATTALRHCERSVAIHVFLSTLWHRKA
jgi:hypothetical protein